MRDLYGANLNEVLIATKTVGSLGLPFGLGYDCVHLLLIPRNLCDQVQGQAAQKKPKKSIRCETGIKFYLFVIVSYIFNAKMLFASL